MRLRLKNPVEQPSLITAFVTQLRCKTNLVNVPDRKQPQLHAPFTVIRSRNNESHVNPAVESFYLNFKASLSVG